MLGLPQGGPNRRDGSGAARVHPAAGTKARSTGRQQPAATTAAAATAGGAASGAAAGVLQLRWYERVVVVVTVTDPSLIVI